MTANGTPLSDITQQLQDRGLLAALDIALVEVIAALPEDDPNRADLQLAEAALVRLYAIHELPTRFPFVATKRDCGGLSVETIYTFVDEAGNTVVFEPPNRLDAGQLYELSGAQGLCKVGWDVQCSSLHEARTILAARDGDDDEDAQWEHQHQAGTLPEHSLSEEA